MLPAGPHEELAAESKKSSICIFVHKSFYHGHEQDLEIKEHGPVLYIIDIMPDTFFDGSIPPEAVDLGPACKTGTNLMLYHVTGYLLLKLFHELGALGSGTHQ